LTSLALFVVTGGAGAQYPHPSNGPPRVRLGAPVPADERAYPNVGRVANLPDLQARTAPCPTCAPQPPATPPLPFLGARYSFYAPRTPCQSFSHYGPGYVAPQFFNPRYPDAGPYFHTPGYPYSPTYYSYYYTPGFFRY
jgi:hypothetical protein